MGKQPCSLGCEADVGDPDGSLDQQGEEVEAGGAGCYRPATGGGGKGRGGGVGVCGVLGAQFLPLLLGNQLFNGLPLLDPLVLLDPDLLATLGLDTGQQTILPWQTKPW